MELDTHIAVIGLMIEEIEEQIERHVDRGYDEDAIGDGTRKQELEALLRYLESQKRLVLMPPDGVGDILDLPDAVIEQLSVKKPDDLEAQIITVMRAAGGQNVNLDQVIVGLFRTYRQVHERRVVQTKLYRMNERGFVYRDQNEQGVFSLTERYMPPKPPAKGRGDLDDDIPF